MVCSSWRFDGVTVLLFLKKSPELEGHLSTWQLQRGSDPQCCLVLIFRCAIELELGSKILYWRIVNHSRLPITTAGTQWRAGEIVLVTNTVLANLKKRLINNWFLKDEYCILRMNMINMICSCILNECYVFVMLSCLLVREICNISFFRCWLFLQRCDHGEVEDDWTN